MVTCTGETNSHTGQLVWPPTQSAGPQIDVSIHPYASLHPVYSPAAVALHTFCLAVVLLSAVCLLLHTTQVARYLTPKMLQAAAESNILLKQIDYSRPLAPQGPFDVIIHKLRPNPGVSVCGLQLLTLQQHGGERMRRVPHTALV